MIANILLKNKICPLLSATWIFLWILFIKNKIYPLYHLSATCEYFCEYYSEKIRFAPFYQQLVGLSALAGPMVQAVLKLTEKTIKTIQKLIKTTTTPSSKVWKINLWLVLIAWLKKGSVKVWLTPDYPGFYSVAQKTWLKKKPIGMCVCYNTTICIQKILHSRYVLLTQLIAICSSH